jgi:putative ABC transport system permease protein
MSALLTWRILTDRPVGTLVAIAGVGVAAALLFMQWGFLDSISLIADLIPESLDCDIVLASRYYVMLTQAQNFPRQRLYQAASHPDVERVTPLYVSRVLWRNPEKGYLRSVMALGIRPDDLAIGNTEVRQQQYLITNEDTALVDRLTRDDLGPKEIGTVIRVGQCKLKVAGQFQIGPGFETGLLLVSDQTFSGLLGGWPLDKVHLGLIKLRPGAAASIEDVAGVAQALDDLLPPDVQVMTRDQLKGREREFWVHETATGAIFRFGVIVAVLFGGVIVYQVLSLEVTGRLPEFATLKAMGYSDGFLARVVLQQSVLLAILSYIPGILLAFWIYALANGVTHLPVYMTPLRAAGVFVADLFMCTFSGLMAIRILRGADPADKFST